MRAGLLAPLLLLSCAETPAAPPSPAEDTRYWLDVCAAHGYSQAETAMATGREARDVYLLQQRYGTRPPPAPADRLLLLPYPGARHPRLGFQERAVDPHRDTKCSVFLPGGGYVVIDVPEAVWCDGELVYQAHTPLPTQGGTQGILPDRVD